ncbi:MAG: polymer-forming cytoskeletal protein [Spartobacteria bacterium]|nr:polymer-forming cytoskeletal protein [Spartobacteria bacterium]
MDNEVTAKSIIDSQVEITGTVKTPGGIQIDGKLQGDLECGGDAIIGKSAQIKGNLVVNAISIAGAINGNVTAKDRIEMKSTARVMGDIKAKRLAVEDGVTFVGKSEVNPTGAPVNAASENKPSAPPPDKVPDLPPPNENKGGFGKK